MKINNDLSCPYNRSNCHGFGHENGRGICVVLKDVTFPGDCPFYKDKKKLDAEREAIESKLMAEGRVDLLAKYGYLRK